MNKEIVVGWLFEVCMEAVVVAVGQLDLGEGLPGLAEALALRPWGRLRRF